MLAAAVFGGLAGWIIYETLFKLPQFLDGSNEANTVEKRVGSLDDFFGEVGLIPLKVTICGNECGCIALRTRGEVVWTTPTTDMYQLTIPS